MDRETRSCGVRVRGAGGPWVGVLGIPPLLKWGPGGVPPTGWGPGGVVASRWGSWGGVFPTGGVLGVSPSPQVGVLEVSRPPEVGSWGCVSPRWGSWGSPPPSRWGSRPPLTVSRLWGQSMKPWRPPARCTSSGPCGGGGGCHMEGGPAQGQGDPQGAELARTGAGQCRGRGHPESALPWAQVVRAPPGRGYSKGRGVVTAGGVAFPGLPLRLLRAQGGVAGPGAGSTGGVVIEGEAWSSRERGRGHSGGVAFFRVPSGTFQGKRGRDPPGSGVYGGRGHR